MGMNPRGRSRGRNHNFNNNRRFNNGPSRNTVYDSIGPAGRLRGTAFQLMEKYQSAAKELMASDRVMAENCLQHADHYLRLNAMAIAAEQRFNPQPQQQSAPVTGEDETQEQSDADQNADVISVSEPVTVEPVVPVVPVVSVIDTIENVPDVAKMDLSVPVSVMVENEMKARRGRPALKKDNAVAVESVAPRRRGRPPMKKAESEV